MRNIFNRFRGKKRLRRPSSKPRINTPYERPEKQDHSGKGRSSHGKKTLVRNKPGETFNESGAGNELICPQCQYHLRTEPSVSSPCPNCGFVGDGNVHVTQSDRKTVVVSNLDLNSDPEMSEFHFDLVSESSGSKIRIESEDPELTLNRDHLEPGNNTISANQHVLIKFHEGRVFLSDVSSNGATYIQVSEQSGLLPDTKIVIGNQIYTFKQKMTGDAGQGGSTRTLNFGGIQEGNDTNQFELVEDKSGKKVKLAAGINTLNRSTLDPGNSSISSKEHVRLEYINGQWFISDVSSNHATFIQVRTESELKNGIKLIVGSTVFTFER